MAKKSVATLQTGSKRFTKAIKMVKKEGSVTYSFVETIIDPKHVRDWIANKPIKQEVIPAKSVEQKATNKEVTDEKESNQGNVEDKTKK